MKMSDVVIAVLRERARQEAKWGQQNHPDGSGRRWYGDAAASYRMMCDSRHQRGEGTWADIFLEEAFEALAEEDETKLKAELIQVAAVCVAWVQAIDRR